MFWLRKKETNKTNKQRDYVEDPDTDRSHVNNVLLKKQTNKTLCGRPRHW